MMGRLVNRAKNNQVQYPPPTLRARKAGTITRRDNKSVLEKLSEPAPSAGKGAFLMVGYYIIVNWGLIYILMESEKGYLHWSS